MKCVHIISLLICLSVLVAMPASAEVLIHDVSYTSSGVGMNGADWLLLNLSVGLPQITRVEWQSLPDQAAYMSVVSGSVNVDLCEGFGGTYSDIGDGVYSWDCVDHGGGPGAANSTCSAEIAITTWSPVDTMPDGDLHNVIFGNIGTACSGATGDYVRAFGTPDDIMPHMMQQYGILMTGQLNGEHKIYGNPIYTPVCSFTANPTSGPAPLFVTFIDTSTGSPSSWLWQIRNNATGLLVRQSTGNTFIDILNGENLQFDVNLTASNIAGTCNIFAPKYLTTYGPIGPGVVTTWVQAVDGLTSGAVHGSDIQIKNVQTGVWINTTNDQDGTSSITTNTTATIDAYAQATGYLPASRTGLTPADVVYELIMWPSTAFLPPGTGNVNLAVIVNDRLTTAPIQGASVSVTVPSGATTGGSTNAAGTETFVVPNMSVVHITVKKTGYTTASTAITTTAFGPDTKRIELSKATVTPTITGTPLPGEATVRPTLDTRTPKEKDADMMNQIRDAGPGLIALALIVTVIGLIKIIGK